MRSDFFPGARNVSCPATRGFWVPAFFTTPTATAPDWLEEASIVTRKEAVCVLNGP
jgi:hypothetical protein